MEVPRELSRLKKGKAMIRSNAMTIGQLSRRTSVPIKLLRTYEDFGFVCTRGRSESNYRLFGEEALRCVQLVQCLRSLGLTLKVIQAFIRRAYQQPGEPAAGLLQEYLAQALTRIETQISTLQARRQRILKFQTASAGRADQSAALALIQMFATNPRCDTDHFPF
jgi:MerR family transcriptional regulator, copper efflux regulator